MASQNQPQSEENVVYIPIPFGLVGQWLQFERYRQNAPDFRRELTIGLRDWNGRWSMLHWVTERVVADYAVASRVPRDYSKDVGLEYHLGFWFITMRLCYDTIAYIAVQMAADCDRGKLPSLSFNSLSTTKVRESFQPLTKALLKMVQDARGDFEELKTIRDNLIHFVGKSGGKVEPPKRINIDLPNEEGVRFTVATTKFADIYGPVEKWPVRATMVKHFRCLYEIAARLECRFLDDVATEKIPGAYRYMYRDMFDFLDVKAVQDFGHAQWSTTGDAT